MTTAISKREPRAVKAWEPMQAVREEFEGLWNQLIGERAPGWFAMQMAPALDLTETAKTVEVRMDLPGFTTDEINVQLNNNVLTISGAREEEQKEDVATFHRIERRSGSFSRSVALPTHVVEEKVDAKFRNGVLAVTLQKCADEKCRKIKVHE
ncbi:Hsp20/alpha crystallin family protein [Lacipirellula parvula]|uniref:SHSP domain-containing protein n=1 Tax=Lacipirellula parvula TaxID=2650471 RepID=A0A5K7X7D0_9BACT|nr:Hsp20/alpha crystallin family protein [Lacipirellula parvula]BBO32285.1 hypothetical protein PLANPX_1897 [Lacipirellula parvula]